MAVESGKNGKVAIGSNDVADVTRWTFQKEVVASRYASSSTAGFRRSVAGVKSGAGTIDFKWDSSAASPVTEGSSVTLKLYLNAADFYSVPALISRFEISVDIDTGEVTGGRASFVTDGAWTEPSLA